MNLESHMSNSIFSGILGGASVIDFGLLRPYHVIDIVQGYKERGTSFIKLLTATSQAESTDSRDRVFSLLGLASGNVAKEILPDYTLHHATYFAQLFGLY